MNEERINVVWPDWKITGKIGRGSFGCVYEIERVQFGKTEKAAMKALTIPQDESIIDELYSDGYDDESITKRLDGELQDIVKEYYLMAELKGHTNVVNCDDLQYTKNGMGWDVFIKMELLIPLNKVFRKGSGETVSDEAVIKLGKDICQALILCEKKNIVHRDIKPQNIFRSEFGEYKLGDFGIAKTMEHTTSGTKTGTYKYMAPEVYSNKPYGHSADIYSLGLVLYWLLNENRMPFLPLPPEIPTSLMDDKARTRRFGGEKIPEPKNGSPALKKIVLKACEFEPKDRFASAQDMLNALEGLSEVKEKYCEDANGSLGDPEVELNRSRQQECVRDKDLRNKSDEEKIQIVYPDWKVTRLIGRDSFGSVYEIQRIQFGKTEKAAVKVITFPYDRSIIDELHNEGYDDASISKRLSREFQYIVKGYYLMMELKGHTNVVNCDDIQYIENKESIGWDVFIKMEPLTSLYKAFGKGNGKNISDEAVIKLGKDICRSLMFCEKKNIVHRDINPHTIFRSGDGEYKLGDFSVAKTIERTASGTFTGTYKYMAPEVFNKMPYGHSVDIYSLGLVLYWLLNEKRMPFLPLPPAISTSSMEDEARAKRFGGAKIPEPKNGSPELKKIILKACEFKPKDRFASAQDMLNALKKLSGEKEDIHKMAYEEEYEYEHTAGGTAGSGFSGTRTERDSDYSFSSENESTMGNSWEDTQGTMGNPGGGAKKEFAEYEKTVGKQKEYEK